MHFFISIIVCTYNPDNRYFIKCMNRIAELLCKFPNRLECIIVDNASEPTLSERPEIRELLIKNPLFQCIEEKKSGKTYALTTGFHMSKGDWICIVDDDNLLDDNYFHEFCKLFNQYPYVGIWGPGSIDVEYLDQPPAWLLNDFPDAFLKSDFKEVIIQSVPGIPTPMISGAGMLLSRVVMSEYIRLVESGSYSQTCRKGNSLSSAGDLQMLFVARRLNIPIGLSPTLKFTHVIPPNRMSIDYITRLTYEAMRSVRKAELEEKPELRFNLINQTLPIYRVLFSTIVKIPLRSLFLFTRLRSSYYRIQYARYLSSVVNQYESTDKTVPWIIQFLVKTFVGNVPI